MTDAWRIIEHEGDVVCGCDCGCVRPLTQGNVMAEDVTDAPPDAIPPFDAVVIPR